MFNASKSMRLIAEAERIVPIGYSTAELYKKNLCIDLANQLKAALEEIERLKTELARLYEVTCREG